MKKPLLLHTVILAMFIPSYGMAQNIADQILTLDPSILTPIGEGERGACASCPSGKEAYYFPPNIEALESIDLGRFDLDDIMATCTENGFSSQECLSHRQRFQIVVAQYDLLQCRSMYQYPCDDLSIEFNTRHDTDEKIPIFRSVDLPLFGCRMGDRYFGSPQNDPRPAITKLAAILSVHCAGGPKR